MVVCMDIKRFYGCVVFFKQKTAYEVRISDWSSDVCSSDRPMPTSREPDDRRRRVGMIMLVTPLDSRALLPLSGEKRKAALGTSSRSEERRVWTECVSTCRSRWSTYHLQKTSAQFVGIISLILPSCTLTTSCHTNQNS